LQDEQACRHPIERPIILMNEKTLFFIKLRHAV
jgi:hypothetical protein